MNRINRESLRALARLLLAAFYAAAGVLHLNLPAPFIYITPAWVPAPRIVVALTGIAELAGAAGLVQWQWPALRRAAGWGLALYALCVWPANFNHMLLDLAHANSGAGLGYHIPRLAAQPLLIWLALWVSRATAIGDGGLRR
jgi:uncharacterized membrane protein